MSDPMKRDGGSMTDLGQRVANLSPAKLKRLMRYLEEKEGSDGGVKITPRPRTGEPVPVSFPQRRLWFLEQLRPGSAAYNLPSALRLSGELRAPVLARSLAEVRRRHEALRTRFEEHRGEPVQVIDPAGRPHLPVVDLQALPAASRQREADRLSRDEARRPFDLSRGPLFRSTLVRLGPGDHLLLQNMHHIVSDAWSRGVLLRETALLYEAYGEGRASPLSELPVQYGDFAAWQRERVSGERLEADLAYWRERLRDAPEGLDLPTDRPRRPVGLGAAGVVTTRIRRAQMERVEAVGRRAGATAFMTLFAAFAVLLGRYSDQDDLIVATPIANRPDRQTEDLVGFFVNTLLLRVDLSGDPRFIDLLGRVRQTAMEAYAHQDLPLEKLVEELRPERSQGRQPLFSGMFSLENVPAGSLRMPGLTFTPVEVDGEAAKFDWILALEPGDEGYRVRLQYSRDLFHATTMRRWLAHYERLLEAAVGAPEVALSRLPLLSRQEHHAVLVEWGEGAPLDPGGRPVHELLAEQAERTPDAAALVSGDSVLSYREVRLRSRRLAERLRSLGAGPEVVVAVALERSPEMVIAFLAVLEAGGAYLPLDPSYPDDRLALLLADSGAPLVLCRAATEARLAALASPAGARVLDMGTLDRPVSGDTEGASGLPGAEDGGTPAGLEAAAYLLYTSGSTGRPKGVAVPHRALVNHLRWMAEVFPVAPGDAVLQKTPVSFDPSVWELYAPLVAGGHLVVPRPGLERDAAALAREVECHRVPVLRVVPPLLQTLLDTAGPWAFRGLDRLLCGGEALPRALAQRFTDTTTAELANLYGPTEATVVSTAWRLTEGEVGAEGATVPIGRPVANARLRVMDGGGRSVPPGVAGELGIGGAVLARGYAARPALTAERFVPDPGCGTAGRRPGERLYRTGDRVRWLGDGRLEFLGRLDHQVKVRGFRVEPGEIEAALRRHDGVREAAVVARPGEAGAGAELVAFLVPQEGAAPSREELRRFLRSVLPEHMVPQGFEVLEALPLNRSGKVDRRALVDRVGHRLATETPFVAPRNELEETLAEMWSEVLPTDRVGVESDFFDLGGHSLLATRLLSRIREELEVDLSLATFFEGPTVAELAKGVEVARWAVEVHREGDGFPVSTAAEREEGEI